MENIVLIMQRKPIAEGLMNKLKNSPHIRLIYESDYEKAKAVVEGEDAKAALIEVTESGPYHIGHCLELCRQVKKDRPDCKLIIMCPEEEEESVKEVVRAKGKGLIHDFVFYDVTTDYLASKLISL